MVRARRLTLVATIVGSSMTFIDATVVNIALPTIGRDLDAGLAIQQWVVLSYSLAVASLYVVSGALGDRYGRRLMFLLGTGGFAASSALAGVAPTSGLLVAARVLQGITGALLTTNSLALLRATYGADSGRAVGLWTAWSGIGTMLGPPAGGLLVQYASWRWIFFINLPGAALAVFMAWAGRHDEAPVPDPRPINLPAAAAIAVAFGSLTYGLVRGAQAGFGTVWWAFAVAVAGVGFLAVSERRSANPLLPDRLIRARLFVVANLYTFLVYAALGGSTFYLALYLQSAAVGYSPSRASLVFLPISIVMFVLASRFGRLADRDGPRLYLTVAPLVMAAGLALLTVVTSTNPIVALPGVLVFAVGLACLVAPITSTALKASPDEYVGLAAGVNTTVSRIGGLVATPLLGVVITLVFAAQTSGGSGDPFATHGLTADQRAATIDSFRAGIGVAALLCIAGALLAARELPSGGGEGRPDAAPEPPPAPAPGPAGSR